MKRNGKASIFIPIKFSSEMYDSDIDEIIPESPVLNAIKRNWFSGHPERVRFTIGNLIENYHEVMNGRGMGEKKRKDLNNLLVEESITRMNNDELLNWVLDLAEANIGLLEEEE